MASGWLSRGKAPAIILMMFALVASLHFVLPLLGPAADRIEAELLRIAAAPEAVPAALAAASYHLWLAAKALVFPTFVLALTFLVERRFSEAEREPKDYATAAAVQIVFLFTAYAATMLISKLVPLPDFMLLTPPEGGSPLISAAWTFAAVGVYLIAFDFLLYWAHRAHHAIPILWKFHSVHHSAHDLDALHNFVHPVELLVRYFVIAIPLGLIVQIDQFQFYALFAFLAIQNQLNHMNVPVNFGVLGAVFVDNRHHFIHHSRERRHHDRNFAAIFSFTDRIFGTYAAPAAGALPKTGFDACERPSRLSDYLLARATKPTPAVARAASFEFMPEGAISGPESALTIDVDGADQSSSTCLMLGTPTSHHKAPAAATAPVTTNAVV